MKSAVFVGGVAALSVALIVASAVNYLPYDARMATRLTGWAAIDFARGNGITLSVLATGGERARDDVSAEEAETIAATRPEQVYVDFDEPDDDGGLDA